MEDKRRVLWHYWEWPIGRGFQEVLASYLSSGILLLMIFSLSFIIPLCIPFSPYNGLAVWGNTYASDNFKTELLPWKSRLIITLSKLDAQLSPLFSQLGLIKLMDLVTHDCEDHSLLDVVTVRNKWKCKLLPDVWPKFHAVDIEPRQVPRIPFTLTSFPWQVPLSRKTCWLYTLSSSPWQIFLWQVFLGSVNGKYDKCTWQVIYTSKYRPC